jgi:RimJ/RimL family protein N-acetyltransferase
VLKGPNFHLRLVRKGDLDKLYEFISDIEIRGPHFPIDIESESSFLERFNKTGFWTDDRGMMLIVENGTNRLLGQLVFFKPEPYYHAFEIGYLIYDPNDRGKGITSSAVKIFSHYLMDLRNVPRIQIQLDRGNGASRRVAEKAGFTFEGIARSAMIFKGKVIDLEVFSLTRSDLEA